MSFVPTGHHPRGRPKDQPDQVWRQTLGPLLQPLRVDRPVQRAAEGCDG